MLAKGRARSVRVSRAGDPDQNAQDENEASLSNAKRFAEVARRGELDAQMGFGQFVSGNARIGWMLNMQTVCSVFSDSAV